MFCDQALIIFAKLLTSLPLMVINGYVAEALCSMTFSVKPTWSHDYMGNTVTTDLILW